MFTGIVEEIGIIKSVKKTEVGSQFTITAKLVMDDLRVGDTVVEFENHESIDALDGYHEPKPMVFSGMFFLN